MNVCFLNNIFLWYILILTITSIQSKVIVHDAKQEVTHLQLKNDENGLV